MFLTCLIIAYNDVAYAVKRMMCTLTKEGTLVLVQRQLALVKSSNIRHNTVIVQELRVEVAVLGCLS